MHDYFTMLSAEQRADVDAWLQRVGAVGEGWISYVVLDDDGRRLRVLKYDRGDDGKIVFDALTRKPGVLIDYVVVSERPPVLRVMEFDS